jgi:hypothetical protein
MKIIKQATVTMDTIQMEVPFKWYENVFHSEQWKRKNVKVLNFPGRYTWDNVIIDFEDTPFELYELITDLEIDGTRFQGIRPLKIDPTNPTVVECSIVSAELLN